MDIINILQTNLLKLSRQHTEETLGDRRDYLGASDIGQCPRKVIHERIHPHEHDLATLLRFERGHMAEEIVAKVFTAAGFTNFERQVEIMASSEVAPFIVHIDFVFTSWSSKVKSILEVKSCSVPSAPYGSWESQLYAQMGALAEQYPDYTIKGALLSLDLAAGEVGFFQGYQPNDTIFKHLKNKAEDMWIAYQAMLQGNEVELATEPGLLCGGYCNYLLNCPRFAAQEAPDLVGVVEDLQQLQAEEKQLKARIDPLKKNLLAVVQKVGTIKVNSSILRQRNQSRKSINLEKLETVLADLGQSISDFQEPSTCSSWLDIKRCKVA
ncbi:hypothetical protein [Desulfopila aestuarii]|uniref:CRISPR-associated exonuclease Cas4 n=1 Tax=Desulfopila aestuarii DSM 18488 TaxID=1121416 RepID=A0A1M7YI84_9BACT|nr:hypothetical protein [Desulfopila aestuarii]SHO52321.1 CRISPR-associated exonuclease Cas4 [Desulfopila aestuarii DSM 18488]